MLSLNNFPDMLFIGDSDNLCINIICNSSGNRFAILKNLMTSLLLVLLFNSKYPSHRNIIKPYMLIFSSRTSFFLTQTGSSLYELNNL